MLEREYIIPLRKSWLKAPYYKRAKKAVNTLRAFLVRHMKATEKDIKIGKWLNLAIWEHGSRKPPHHIKIKAVKDDKGIVNAELSILPKEAIEEKEKEEAEKKKKGKKKEVKKEEKQKEEEEKEEIEEEKEEAEKKKKEKEKILHKEKKKIEHGLIKQKKTPIRRLALEK